MRGKRVGAQRRATIEAVPAEPQEGRAQHHIRDVGWALGLMQLSRAQEVGGSQGTIARRHVHDHTTSKVQDVVRRDQAAAPHHVRNGAVDNQVPHGDKDEERWEVDTVGNGTNNNGRGDDRKHALEDEESRGRDRQTPIRHSPDVIHQAVRHGLANDAREASVLAKRQSEAKDGPDKGNDSQRSHGRRNRANHVLVVDHATVEEGNTRGHDEDQRRAHEDEGLVSIIQGGARTIIREQHRVITVVGAKSLSKHQAGNGRGAHRHGDRDAKHASQHNGDKQLLLPWRRVVEHGLPDGAGGRNEAHCAGERKSRWSQRRVALCCSRAAGTSE
mmetsp:Transcript_30479/g.62822  ORF Transcript_30479/g.62822 Transcript_30479/m.62822 type:complete len:330 (+) Transcript_30479:879-1868(+)